MKNSKVLMNAFRKYNDGRIHLFERPRGRWGEGVRGRKGFRKISYEKTEGKRRKRK